MSLMMYGKKLHKLNELISLRSADEKSAGEPLDYRFFQEDYFQQLAINQGEKLLKTGVFTQTTET